MNRTLLRKERVGESRGDSTPIDALDPERSSHASEGRKKSKRAPRERARCLESEKGEKCNEGETLLFGAGGLGDGRGEQAPGRGYGSKALEKGGKERGKSE